MAGGDDFHVQANSSDAGGVCGFGPFRAPRSPRRNPQTLATLSGTGSPAGKRLRRRHSQKLLPMSQPAKRPTKGSTKPSTRQPTFRRPQCWQPPRRRPMRISRAIRITPTTRSMTHPTRRRMAVAGMAARGIAAAGTGMSRALTTGGVMALATMAAMVSADGARVVRSTSAANIWAGG